MGKQKCSFWDKCYRKDKTHQKNFLHPGDSDEDSSEDESAGPISLKGKRVTFTGAISKSRKQATAEAEEYGCVVSKGVSGKTDIVVVGSGCGKKYDRAEDLGLEVYEESDWRKLLASAKKLPKKEVEMATVGKALAHNVSDSEDEIMFESEKVKTTKAKPAAEKRTAKKRGACVHDISSASSGSETEEDGPTPAKKAKESPPAKVVKPKRKTATKKRRLKCKYWGKCYQKNADHKKTFAHPDDDDADEAADDDEDMDTGEGTSTEPKHSLDDGDSVEIKGGLHGLNVYRIKRSGDVYACSCVGWKKQTARGENERTCRHLRDHLGVAFEKARVGDSGPGWSGDPKAKARQPRHKNIGSLMLAHKWTDSVNPKGWWMSEKLDGVRAYWDGKAFYSRLGNEFIPPAWFVEDFPTDMELDGELFGGRGKFQSTVSIVKNAGIDKWKNLKYMIFDAPHLMKQPFEKRIEALETHFNENEVKYAEVLEQTKCKSEEHLMTEQKRVEALGGEGMMIRQPGSKYEHARSKALLKIKTFYDAEAIVIGHEKGKGRNSHRCGALRCKMANGTLFNVGSGLSDKERNHPPKKGSIITYKFQEYTNSGVPRFPSYIGVRIDATGPSDAVLPAKPTDD